MKIRLFIALGGIVLVWCIYWHIRVGMSLPSVDQGQEAYPLSAPGVYHTSDSTAIIISHDTMRVSYDSYGIFTLRRK